MADQNWEGVPDTSEHRTTGGRAWCFNDSEWCSPALLCQCCDVTRVPDHDELCPAPGSTMHGCICVGLRERDAKVRADERAKVLIMTPATSVVPGAIEAGVRERIAQAIEAEHGKAPSTYWDDALDTAAAIARGDT